MRRSDGSSLARRVGKRTQSDSKEDVRSIKRLTLKVDGRDGVIDLIGGANTM